MNHHIETRRSAPGRARRAGLFAIMLAVAGAGCAEFSFTGAGRATLTYTEDAQAAYNEALDAYKARSWEDARALFSEVKKLFTYSRYARLAELRLADIDFEQSKFSDAVAGYRDFVQNHRSDRDVEYARYRICKSLFNDIEDSFILPPAEERDQATTMSAYTELRQFVSDNPQSRYIADVKYMHDVVLQRLARHELYVARFYLKTDQFEAAASRIEYALRRYPGSGLDSEGLLLLGETLLKMKRVADARVVFQRNVTQYATPFSEASKRYLQDLGPPKPEEAVPAGAAATTPSKEAP